MMRTRLDRSERRGIRDVLIAAVGKDLVPDRHMWADSLARLTPTSWTILPEVADFHGVTPLLDAAIQLYAQGVPSRVRGEIRNRAIAHRGGRLKLYSALIEIAPVLDASAPGWVLLKGAALGDYVFAKPGLRTFSDIDVLIAPSQVRSAVAGLEAHGAQLLSRNWSYVHEHGRAELVFLLPGGVPLDLHWGLLANPRNAPSFTFDTARLLRTAEGVDLNGPEPVRVNVLSPADMLLHVSVHGVLSGLATLRNCLDVDQAFRKLGEVSSLHTAVSESHAGLALAVALHRSASTLRHGADRRFRSQVGWPRAWELFMRLNDALNPASRGHEPYALRFLPACTRCTSRESFGELGSFATHKAQASRSPMEVVRRLATGATKTEPEPLSMLSVEEGAREGLLSALDKD